jgi:excisionase family DNA binding protein
MMLPPEVLEGLEAWLRSVVQDEFAAVLSTQRTEPHKWLNVREAAEYLRVSQRTLERLVASGEIRSANVERRRIIRREWLDEYATSGEGGHAVPTTTNGGQHAR